MKKTEFRAMSEIEIAIRKMKDVKMVHIYELTGADLKQGVTGCIAIAVAYGENQQINLTENDEGFQALVNKIYDIYEENKDIIMDETTRLLLDSGVAFGMERSLEPFYKLEAVQPLIYHESLLSKRFISVAEYLVCALYELFDINVQVVKREAGWRGSCLLEIDVDGKSTVLYGKTMKINNQHYAITVTNVLKDCATMLINVRIGFGNMDITFHSDILNIDGTFSYDYKDNKLVESKEILYENKTVYYDVKDYEADDNIYQLPFGVDYVIEKECAKSGTMETTYILGRYTWKNASYTEVTGWTEVYNTSENIRLKIHSMHVQEVYLENGKVQLYFLETGGHTSEKYRQQLQGKYFIQ